MRSMIAMKRSLFFTASIAACFALMGVAYAAWTQNVTVVGNASMGNFEIIWQDVSLDRRGEPRYGNSYVPEVTYSVTDGGHKISYSVTNAYPGWESRIRCRVKNNGTVPAKLAITLSNPGGVVSVTGYDALPRQLAAGATSDEVTLTVSVPSAITEQSATYTFTLTVTGTQFNVNP